MDREQYDASRLAVCTAWITGVELGVDRPLRVPNDDDMRKYYAWCAAKWEELQRADGSDPWVARQRAMFRHPGPSPSEITAWRDYSAQFGALEYESVVKWWRSREWTRLP